MPLGALGMLGMLCLPISGCGSVAPPSSAQDRLANGQAESGTRLLDRIWQADPGRFIDNDALLAQARSSRIVLLGETHDNLAHHAWQNRVLAVLAAQQPAPALVMEQFDLEQQPAIDSILRSDKPAETRAALLLALMPDGWNKAGYRSLLETASRYRLPVVAGNLSRASLRTVSRDGFDALGAGEALRLGLDHRGTWQPAQQQALETDVAEGHCGMLPVSAIGAVARAQRARDAVLADRMLTAANRPGQPGVVAILGRGHVRRDLAVPLYLTLRTPELTVLVVDFDEVTDDRIAPDYATGTLGKRYDVVVFSPAVERADDPCKELRGPRSEASK